MPNIKIDHWHPLAEKFELLHGDEWESFLASIRKSRGNRTPIIYRRLPDGRNQGIDGRLRHKACEETGQKCRMEEEILETEEEVRDFIIDKNVRRRHMSKEARAAIAAELRADGQSTRQIAKTLGVSQPTVLSDLRIAGDKNLSPEAPAKVTGSDGKTYPATKPPREPETITVFEPAPEPPPPPIGAGLIPELRLKVLSPRIIPEVEALTPVQQQSFLARLNSGVYAGKALAEVKAQVSGQATAAPGCGQVAPSKPADDTDPIRRQHLESGKEFLLQAVEKGLPAQLPLPIADVILAELRRRPIDFVVPTLAEVTAYCRERNNGLDPRQVLDFYVTNNWVQGNKGKPIKDWRGAVRTWEHNKGKFAGKAGKNGHSSGRLLGEFVEEDNE